MKNLKIKERLVNFAIYLLAMLLCVGIAFLMKLLLISVSLTKITCFNIEFDALYLFMCFVSGFLFGDKIERGLRRIFIR